MNNHPRECKSTIIPGIYYRNASAMIEWLCEAFGFEKQLVVPGPGGIVMHSQLTFGNGMIMVGSADRGAPSSTAAGDSSGIASAEMMVSLLVSDCGQAYARAKSVGAEIVSELEKKSFGGEAFTCRDPEAHIWNVSSHNPWES